MNKISKKITAFMLSAICILSCGCGAEELNMKEDYNKHVNIGSYKHIVEIDENDKNFSEEKMRESLNVYLDLWNENTSEQTSGTMEEGDIVGISYAIGDESIDTEIELGKDEIAPGIDEQLIGNKTGYILDSKITIDSEEKDIKVITKYIYTNNQIDEVSDEFVAELTNGQMATIDEYIEYMCTTYAEDQKVLYGQSALYTLVTTSQFRDIDAYVNMEYKRLKAAMKAEAEEKGVLESDIYETYGFENSKEYDESLKTIAEYNVKQVLIIYKMADMLNIEVIQDDIDKYSDKFNENLENNTLTGYGEDGLEEYILYRKVMLELYEMQL